MERDLLVRWTKNGRHSVQNSNRSTFYSLNSSDTSVQTANKDNTESAYKKFSLSGSSDEEMIDITAGGENMESHFEQAHAAHGEPVQVKFIAMQDHAESSSESDNEYSKLQGNFFRYRCNISMGKTLQWDEILSKYFTMEVEIENIVHL